jgi:hypothetical protein
MKTKIFFYMVLVTVIFPPISISQDRFSFGLKGGIGLWRFVSLQESPNITLPIVYSHPIGFSLGLYIENKLSDHFSLVNELLYQNSVAKVTIYTGYEGILDQEVSSQYFIVPVLLKYEASWLWNTHLLLGPSLGYLIKANYNFHDQIYFDDEGNEEITKYLPTISTAIEFGFGKEIDISNSDFNFELRGQWGLTKFRCKEGHADIGKWNNIGLIFFVGYKI